MAQPTIENHLSSVEVADHCILLMNMEHSAGALVVPNFNFGCELFTFALEYITSMDNFVCSTFRKIEMFLTGASGNPTEDISSIIPSLSSTINMIIDFLDATHNHLLLVIQLFLSSMNPNHPHFETERFWYAQLFYMGHSSYLKNTVNQLIATLPLPVNQLQIEG